MSYEGEMLKKYKMPSKADLEEALLRALFEHNGTLKEFTAGEEIVDELADTFSLSKEQRQVPLERIYRKENRVVKTPLWHRLLYRAADNLAKEKLITRPTTTLKLTNKREWMLTEEGYDKILELLKMPKNKKDILQIKSFEVQKLVKKLKDSPRPENYNPFVSKRDKRTITRELGIRERGFRQAVIEAYNHRCCICGLKIKSPDNHSWEVEAAHIVPHSINGKDDIWNGIALCSLHHWAFDVGWYSLSDDFRILLSSKYGYLTTDYGKVNNFDFIRGNLTLKDPILLPKDKNLFPHKNAIKWHRENILNK